MQFLCEIDQASKTANLGRGHSTRKTSDFDNDVNENKEKIARIRGKNVNFIMCQFQRFVLYLQKECLGFYFEIDIE